MYSYEKVLPIGSVVLLKEAQKRLMIIGYQRTASKDDGHIYDYCACPYPEGFISQAETFLFDHTQIDRVIAIGFQNEEEVSFQSQLKDIINSRESTEEEAN